MNRVRIIFRSFSDLAVAKVFSEDGGVLGFVKLCLPQCKIFKDEIVKAFELFVKVIESYPNKVISMATVVVNVRYWNVEIYSL